MRARMADWQADDVLQLVDTLHTLKSSGEPAHFAHYRAPEVNCTSLSFFLELLSVPQCPVCLLSWVVFVTRYRHGGAGGPGVWEVRLCAPGWGDDGAVYGEPEVEVRPEIQLEEEGRGEQLGPRDARACVSFICSMKHHINIENVVFLHVFVELPVK